MQPESAAPTAYAAGQAGCAHAQLLLILAVQLPRETWNVAQASCALWVQGVLGSALVLNL